MSYDIHIKPPTNIYESYEDNITWNLSDMLRRAGWHPIAFRGMTVLRLRVIVRNSLAVLVQNEDYFRQFNSSNQWGTTETAIEFLSKLSEYLEQAPDEYIMEVT